MYISLSVSYNSDNYYENFMANLDKLHKSISYEWMKLQEKANNCASLFGQEIDIFVINHSS